MLLGGVCRIGVTLVTGDCLVLHSVVGGKVGVLQRQRRRGEAEQGDRALSRDSPWPGPPEQSAEQARPCHRRAELDVLERQLDLRHPALDQGQERQRLSEFDDSSHADELRSAPLEPRFCPGGDLYVAGSGADGHRPMLGPVDE